MKHRWVASIMIGGALLLGSITAASAQRHNDADLADLNGGLLNIFPRESLICGRGWRFPVLIWGDRPVSACILKTRQRNVFGGDFWF